MFLIIPVLFQISDATGQMSVTFQSNGPFKQGMLSQNECYILDDGANNNIFVWKGDAFYLSVHPIWGFCQFETNQLILGL